MASRIEHNTITPDVETSSDEYRGRFDGPIGRFFLETQIDAVARALGPDRFEPLRVLDVGGGHGQLTEFLLDQGCDVWVQGSAPRCRRQIEPLMGRFGERLHFVSSSLWSLPFADQSFDLVMAVRVMSHVERWEALLAEMARVTKQRLLIDYAALSSANILTPLLFRAKRRIEGNTRPYFCYTAGRLLRYLRTLGFARIRRCKQLFAPMGLHRKLNSPRLSAGVESVCETLGLTRMFGSPVIMVAQRAGEPAPAQSRQLEGGGTIP